GHFSVVPGQLTCGGRRGLLASELFLLLSREDGGVLDKMKPRGSIARAVEWLAALRGQVALGRRGERAAEIDLVAMDGDTLVFVEVKTRRSRAAGAPEEAVDERKQTRMRRAAEVFAARYRADEIEMRFDIVAVDASGKRLEIELLRNAF